MPIAVGASMVWPFLAGLLVAAGASALYLRRRGHAGLHAAMLDALGDAVIATDARGRVTYLNPAAERSLGWTRAEALGRDVVEHTPSVPERDRAAEIMRQLASGASWTGTMTLRRRDGSTYPARVTDTPILDSAGRLRAVVGVSCDISEHVRITEALKRSREHLESLLHGLPIVLYVLDPAGRFILSEGLGLEAAGLRPGELVGASALEMYGELTFEFEDGTTVLGRDLLSRLYAGEMAQALSRVGGRIFENRFETLHDETGTLTALIGVALDVTERERSEQELRRSRTDLRALARRLEAVREEERVRIAREVHDGLGQRLTALAMDVALLKQRIGEDPPSVEILDRMQEMVRSTVSEVRRISSELRPPELDDLGLPSAVEAYVGDFGRRTGLDCALHLLGDTPVPSSAAAVAAFRVLQEALTNVVRHADAQRVTIRLEALPGKLHLEVADDGRGLPATLPSGPRALGILGMKERAIALGGTVDVATPEEGGTLVRAVIPLHGTSS